jgi:ribonuclease-3
MEDRRPEPGALQQPGMPRAEVAARRVSELRHLQPASGRFELTAQVSHGAAGAHVTDSGDPLEQLESLAQVNIDHALLERALTHRSYAYENGGLPTNERLEFLGDSVLGVIVTETLYRTYPDLAEGQLAKLRAAVVNMRALADVSRALGLGEFIRLGRGEESTGGRDKSSILADGLEALIGAVYVDRGLAVATGLVHRLFDDLIEDAARLGAGLDWKTSLQELTASQLLGVPYYEVTESGPDHEKTFEAAVRLGGSIFGTGSGRSKKEAEQQAAEEAWTRIREAVDATLIVEYPGSPAAESLADVDETASSAD